MGIRAVLMREIAAMAVSPLSEARYRVATRETSTRLPVCVTRAGVRSTRRSDRWRSASATRLTRSTGRSRSRSVEATRMAKRSTSILERKFTPIRLGACDVSADCCARLVKTSSSLRAACGRGMRSTTRSSELITRSTYPSPSLLIVKESLSVATRVRTQTEGESAND